MIAMAYDKQDWVDEGVSRTTPLSAARLDHMETGIDEAHQLVDAATDTAGQALAAAPDYDLLAIQEAMAPVTLDTYSGATVTVTPGAPAWEIATFITANQQGQRFRVVGPPLVDDGQGYYFAAWNGANTGVNVVSHEHSFILQGPRASLMVMSYGDMDFQILVDGRAIKSSYTVLPAAAGISFINLDFTDDTSIYKAREIRFFAGQIGIIQWLLPAGGVMRPTSADRLTVGIVAADSFTHGTGETFEGQISAGTLAMELALHTGGKVEVINAGAQGGTGYRNPATGTTATVGPNGQSAYGAPNRVTAATAWVAKADVLMLVGGANDGAKEVYTPASVIAAAQAAWAAYAALAPDKPLIVVGIEDNVFHPITPDLEQLNAAMRTAAENSPHVTAYLDLREANISYGTGNMAAPTGDGPEDILKSSDGVHPSRKGNTVIALGILRLLVRTLFRRGGQ